MQFRTIYIYYRTWMYIKWPVLADIWGLRVHLDDEKDRCSLISKTTIFDFVLVVCCEEQRRTQQWIPVVMQYDLRVLYGRSLNDDVDYGRRVRSETSRRIYRCHICRRLNRQVREGASLSCCTAGLGCVSTLLFELYSTAL